MKRNNKTLYEQIMKNVSREVKRVLNENQQNLSPEEKTIEHIKQLFKYFKPYDYDIDTDPEDGCTIERNDGEEIFITRVVYDESDDELSIYGAFTDLDNYDEDVLDEYGDEQEMYYALGNSRFSCSEFDLDELDRLFYIVRNGIYWYKDDNMSDDEFYRITDEIENS